MIPWIFISIIVALILLGILMVFVFKKKKRPMDYYNLFIIGLIWSVIGIPLRNVPLSIVGIALLLVGLINVKKWKANRRRWKDLDKSDRKIVLWIMIILLVLALLGAGAFMFGGF